MDAFSEHQTLDAVVGASGDSKLRVSLTVTPAGLLAIGALVGAILLATTVLVDTSIRAAKAARD